RSFVESIFFPCMATITSPRRTRPCASRVVARMPALAAALFGGTSRTRTPLIPRRSVIWSSAARKPSPSRTTFPWRMSSGTTIDGVDGNCKADSHRGSRRAINRRIDADQPAGAVEQRSAGVSRIDGGVGLNYTLDRPSRHRLDLAPQRTHNTGRKRLIEAERIADCERALTYLQVFRRAYGYRSQSAFRRVDFQHRQVFVGRDADETRLPGGLVGERHLGGPGILDDMVIRDDIAGIVPDKSRSGSFRDLQQIQCEQVARDADRRDVNDGRRCLAKQRDRRLFVGGELAARRDRTRPGTLQSYGAPHGDAPYEQCDQKKNGKQKYAPPSVILRSESRHAARRL